MAASTDQGSVDPVNGGALPRLLGVRRCCQYRRPRGQRPVHLVRRQLRRGERHVLGRSARVCGGRTGNGGRPLFVGATGDHALEANGRPPRFRQCPLDGGFLDVGATVKAAATRALPATLDGYQLVGSNGGVFSSGVAVARGSMAGQRLVQPVVGGAERPDGLGYWLVAGNGSVFAFGDAHFYGSTADVRLAHPITGMAVTPDGKGYWLVAKDGGVFAFGDARFYGSATKVPASSGSSSAPIVDIAATPDGKGYWLVGSTGRVLGFGDATVYGPPAAMHFTHAVTGMAVAPDGKGYWLVAKDGGVFAFGDATFYGSGAGKPLAAPVVSMAVSPFGLGYWLVEAGGQVLAFGSAPYEVEAGKVSAASIVAIVS